MVCWTSQCHKLIEPSINYDFTNQMFCVFFKYCSTKIKLKYNEGKSERLDSK